jgi:hypothetical protein
VRMRTAPSVRLVRRARIQPAVPAPHRSAVTDGRGFGARPRRGREPGRRSISRHAVELARRDSRGIQFGCRIPEAKAGRA